MKLNPVQIRARAIEQGMIQYKFPFFEPEGKDSVMILELRVYTARYEHISLMSIKLLPPSE